MTEQSTYQKLEEIRIATRIVTYHKVQASNLRHLKRQLAIAKALKVPITVDDGDVSMYHHIYPLLIEFKLPAILFIITSLIDTDLPFWWDEVIYYKGKTEGALELKKLKLISNIERVAALEQMRETSGRPLLKYKQLTTGQLLEMQEAGIIIANHSHTHPMFDQCTTEEIRQEMSASKSFFDKAGLHGNDVFAYPNGNFNENVERILIEEKIKYCFLFDHRMNKAEVNPLRLSRLSVNDHTSLLKYKLILSGWHTRFMSLKKRLKR